MGQGGGGGARVEQQQQMHQEEDTSAMGNTVFMGSLVVLVGNGDELHVPHPSSSSSSSSILNFQDSPMDGFLLLLFIDAIHAASFFALLRDLGSIGSALLKGLQMIIVVCISALFFCSTEPTQCLTWWKASSILLVLMGTFSYAFGSSNNKRVMKLKRRKKLCNYNKDVGRKIRMWGDCGDVDDEGAMIPMMDLENATTVVGRRPAMSPPPKQFMSSSGMTPRTH
eukprot:15324188-Ditylum_brightwellii.AAC.1